ncbi:MAG: transketolase [Propionicimonas sp.]|nr:transketolase [Propionicimonas sp.]
MVNEGPVLNEGSLLNDATGAKDSAVVKDSATISASTVVRAADPRDARVIASAIALPAVLVQRKGHGHAGTAMGMAAVAHALFGKVMRHDPGDPRWHGRDRFVLSAGHASLLLYIQLYLTGYGLRLTDLAASRTLDARTPGHPELGHTPGVEMSTGPLGQGVASAVGLALACRHEEALFAHGTGLFDPTIWVLAGDGCLEEGVSGEASSLAGTLGLENLVLVWDDNRITIDGPTSQAFSEDVRARYRAYGWRVLEVTNHLDYDEIVTVLQAARERTGRPTLVAVRSVIGAPSPAHAGDSSAHAGGFGQADVSAILERLGFAPDATLADLVPAEVLAHARSATVRGAEIHRRWDDAYRSWSSSHPESAAARDRHRLGRGLSGLLDQVDTTAALPTRVTNGAVLRALQPSGALWGGSADLAGSTNVALPGPIVTATDPGGVQLRFGIREHAMAAILSGIALHGLWRPYGSTYLAFSDYQRPSIRLAALMSLPALYLYTHDSVAVGEDGPTHQPVEQIASLRLVPGLDVLRPADAGETVAVWRRLLEYPQRPAALVLSRQQLPVLPTVPDAEVARGGYVLWRSSPAAATDDLLFVATGSEVHLALSAARELAAEGHAVRVVSMPCVEWFNAEPESYREAVLPSDLRRRVVVEAGRTDAWWRYAGLDGAVVGVDQFGESGSGSAVLARRGVTVEHVLQVARGMLAR